MGDFPAEWSFIRNLAEGGQSHAFVVRRTGLPDSSDYVLKPLKNTSRKEYFDREIEAYRRLLPGANPRDALIARKDACRSAGPDSKVAVILKTAEMQFERYFETPSLRSRSLLPVLELV